MNGNMSGDPKFVNAAAGDFRLLPGSPAIDAGTSIGAPLTDIDGRRRIDDPATPNRGAGTMPYYDIGASEFGSAPAAPPTVTVAATGPLASRTIALSVSPPASVLNQTGSVFVVATLPASLGGSVYVMSANGGWSAPASCETAAAAYSGPLAAARIPSVAENADLSRLAGTVISAGYGLGATTALACADMLNYATIGAAYTIR